MLSLVPLLFAAHVACQQMGVVGNERIAQLKRYILDKRPDLVETELDAAAYFAPDYAWTKTVRPLRGGGFQPICGCYSGDLMSVASIFSSTPGARPKIDFVPIEDSQPTYGDIWRTNTTTVSRAVANKWEKGRDVQGDLEFNLGPWSGLAFRVMASYKDTSRWGEDVTQTQTTQLSTTERFACPEGKRCQLQTWTFTVEYTGTYFETPVANFTCLPTSVQWKTRSGYARTLAPSSVVALASLVGKSDSWDTQGRKWFTLRGGASREVLTETPAGMTDFLGIGFPPDGVEVEYLSEKKDVSTVFTLIDAKGEPHSVQMWFVVGPRDKAGAAKRDESDAVGELLAGDSEVDVFITHSTIPGHKVDVVREDGTVEHAQ